MFQTAPKYTYFDMDMCGQETNKYRYINLDKCQQTTRRSLFPFRSNIERLSLHKQKVRDHTDNPTENGCQALWVCVCVCERIQHTLVAKSDRTLHADLPPPSHIWNSKTMLLRCKVSCDIITGCWTPAHCWWWCPQVLYLGANNWVFQTHIILTIGCGWVGVKNDVAPDLSQNGPKSDVFHTHPPNQTAL